VPPEYICVPPPIVYRIHYGTDPLTLRDWKAATIKDRLGNETFGHRWDDPQRGFRVEITLLKAPLPLAFDDSDLIDALNVLGLRIEGQERLLRYEPEPIKEVPARPEDRPPT
jgi:hypothetical protein